MPLIFKSGYRGKALNIMINSHLNITLDNCTKKRAPISLGSTSLEILAGSLQCCSCLHLTLGIVALNTPRVLFILSHIMKKDKRTRISPLSFAWHKDN